MAWQTRAAYRRLNITLSEDTVDLLDRLVPRGERSRFIAQLVKRTAQERADLYARLEESYARRAQRDREICAEWDYLSDQVWRRDPRR